MSNIIGELLQSNRIVVLDGATGSELQRRGMAVPPPLWSADAADTHADLLQEIHRQYLDAGADIITANTFRTAPYTLRKIGREDQAAALTARTVEIAKLATQRAGHGIVAGSMAPLEDCYRPELVQSGDALLREHTLHANNLARAGVDLILVETMNTAREAHDAAQAALQTGLPVAVSVVLDPDGDGDLMSMEDLDVAWAHIRALPVDALLVNCAPAEVISLALERMSSFDETRPLGAYANAGGIDGAGQLTMDSVLTPDEYADFGRVWIEIGARIVGGCCCTTPAHIAALRKVL